MMHPPATGHGVTGGRLLSLNESGVMLRIPITVTRPDEAEWTGSTIYLTYKLDINQG
jgi:hypothetical protein